jgi:hypothetical protein
MRQALDHSIRLIKRDYLPSSFGLEDLIGAAYQTWLMRPMRSLAFKLFVTSTAGVVLTLGSSSAAFSAGQRSVKAIHVGFITHLQPRNKKPDLSRALFLK